MLGLWKSDGPLLPLEFARQSRDGRLTLVVTHGVPRVQALWTELRVLDVEEAKAALGLREDLPSKRSVERNIGFWTPTAASSHADAGEIGGWASAKGFRGVVWTALPPKFEGTDYRVPTDAEILCYLTNLSGRTRELAREYIARAPIQIRTPYRQIIEKELGWQPEPAGTRIGS